MPTSLPLKPRQVTALASAAAREFGVGFHAVGEEVRRWRRRAEAIPDPSLRADALHVLDQRRGHLDGAAMFWILPRRRNRGLLRALVTYELIQDYLDNVSERAAAVNGGGGASSTSPWPMRSSRTGHCPTITTLSHGAMTAASCAR